MSIDVNVSVHFMADNLDAAQAAIDGLVLPEGAMMSASVTEMISQGVIQDGTVVPPPQVENPPAS